MNVEVRGGKIPEGSIPEAPSLLKRQLRPTGRCQHKHTHERLTAFMFAHGQRFL